MGSIVKLLGIVIGAIVVLLIVVVVGIMLVFDPNDYKDEIEVAVEQATGRQLTLAGDLELEVFPRLRIALGSAELSNAEGFGAAPFASIGSARLQLEVLPLLSRRIEVGEALLEGLVLNLARNAQGQDNWQDMGGSAPDSADAQSQEASAQGEAFELDVGAIRIENAEVNWADAAAGSSWQLGNFNMQATGFGPGAAFPLSTDFTLAGEAVEVAVEASMQATLALADNRYLLESLEVGLTGEGAAWPGGSGEASVSFGAFEANLEEESVRLEGLALELLGLAVNGSLSGEDLFSNLSLTGGIEIEDFDPQDLLEVFEIEIETADADVMSQAGAEATLVYDAQQMMLEDMELRLDGSTLVGRAGLERDALRFDLEIDAINIDRYLPPSSEDTSEEEGSLDEVDLPLNALEALDASGRLAFGEAQFIGLTLTDAEFSLSAGNGRVQLTPSASLYGGSYGGEVMIQVNGDSAELSLNQRVTDVDLTGLGTDLLGMQELSGTGEVQLNLVGTGSNLGEIRRGLDGDVSFRFSDGAWDGFDAWYELRRARAVFDQDPVPEREGPPRTTFSDVSASGVVEDALLTNEDFSATLPFMAVTGSGTVNLLNDALDMALTAAFVDGPTLQEDPEMVDLAGSELPLKVGGTLGEPSILPDFGALVRARAEEAVEERIDEEREELRDRLENRLRGIFDRD